jgi:hypothetical protein
MSAQLSLKKPQSVTELVQLRLKARAVTQQNKTSGGRKALVVSDRNRQEATRELFHDPAIADRCLTKLMAFRPNPPYGLDYSPPDSGRSVCALDDDSDLDIEEESPELKSARECVLRNSREKQAEETARFNRELLLDSSSDEEEEFQGTPPVHDPSPVQYLTQKGDCETFFTISKNSQPVLLAMCQGLVSRPTDAYSGTYVFDTETDDVLKAFPQKALFFPMVKHLKEEALRRARLFKIKPLKKSASKSELTDWLKLHPINNDLDEAFLRFEAGRTYQMILKQAEESEVVERERLASRNWGDHRPWMRFYHVATSDEARVLLRSSNDVLTREELDARNSGVRPLTFYEKVAEMFNDPNTVYVSVSLPDLHSTFADSIELRFEDMPGGAMTADEAKSRMGDARAKMISVRYLS